MANADMKRLMDHAKIRLPGSLDSALQMELFVVLNDFFQTSNIWYEDITFAATPTADTYLQNPSAFTYVLVPDQGSITRLMGCVDSQGHRQNATMPILGDLILGYSPNIADTYTARVALTVTDPVTVEGYPEFPDWVLTKYGNEILDGLLGQMMSQIAKPYTSPNIAAVHLKKFKSGMSQAKVEASHQNVYRGQSWRFPQGYASRRTMKF